jgi:hypothetical protein
MGSALRSIAVFLPLTWLTNAVRRPWRWVVPPQGWVDLVDGPATENGAAG